MSGPGALWLSIHFPYGRMLTLFKSLWIAHTYNQHAYIQTMRNKRRIDCSSCTKSHSESVGQAANTFHSFFIFCSGPLHSLASQFFRRSFIAGVKFAWLLVRFSWMKPVVTQLPISSIAAMQSIGRLSALLPFFCRLYLTYCSCCCCSYFLVAWQTEIGRTLPMKWDNQMQACFPSWTTTLTQIRINNNKPQHW